MRLRSPVTSVIEFGYPCVAVAILLMMRRVDYSSSRSVELNQIQTLRDRLGSPNDYLDFDTAKITALQGGRGAVEVGDPSSYLPWSGVKPWTANASYGEGNDDRIKGNDQGDEINEENGKLDPGGGDGLGVSIEGEREKWWKRSENFLLTSVFADEETDKILKENLWLEYQVWATAWASVFVLPNLLLMQTLMEEKEYRVRDFIQLYGASDFAYWFGHHLTSLSQSIIQSGVITIIVYALLTPRSSSLPSTSLAPASLSQTSFSVIETFTETSAATRRHGVGALLKFFALISMFLSACVSVAVLVSSLIDSTRVALFGYSNIYLILTLLFFKSRSPSPAVLLSPPAALICGVDKYLGGLTVSQYKALTLTDQSLLTFACPFSSYEIFSFLLLDTIVYLILGWYILQLRPGNFGVPKNWSFPFRARYWRAHGRAWQARRKAWVVRQTFHPLEVTSDLFQPELSTAATTNASATTTLNANATIINGPSTNAANAIAPGGINAAPSSATPTVTSVAKSPAVASPAVASAAVASAAEASAAVASAAGNASPTVPPADAATGVGSEQAVIIISEVHKIFTNKFVDWRRVKNWVKRKLEIGLLRVPSGFHGLKGVSFKVHKGEVCCLMGRNGSGKTALLNILCGFSDATSGNVSIGGLDVHNAIGLARKSVGFAPSSTFFLEGMTVNEQFHFAAQLKHIPSHTASCEVEVALRLIEMYDKRNFLPHLLSTGEKKRVSIGLAFLGNPRAIIIDGLSTALDTGSKQIIYRALEEMRKDRAVLVSTNSCEDADAVADRIIVLENGRVKANGSPLFLKSKFDNGVILSMVDSGKPPPQTADETKFENAGFSLRNNVEARLRMVRSFCPSALSLNSFGVELKFRIGNEHRDRVPKLVDYLEQQGPRLGVRNVTVSSTDLACILQRIAEDTAADIERRKAMRSRLQREATRAAAAAGGSGGPGGGSRLDGAHGENERNFQSRYQSRTSGHDRDGDHGGVDGENRGLGSNGEKVVGGRYPSVSAVLGSRGGDGDDDDDSKGKITGAATRSRLMDLPRLVSGRAAAALRRITSHAISTHDFYSDEDDDEDDDDDDELDDDNDNGSLANFDNKENEPADLLRDRNRLPSKESKEKGKGGELMSIRSTTVSAAGEPLSHTHTDTHTDTHTHTYRNNRSPPGSRQSEGRQSEGRQSEGRQSFGPIESGGSLSARSEQSSHWSSFACSEDTLEWRDGNLFYKAPGDVGNFKVFTDARFRWRLARTAYNQFKRNIEAVFWKRLHTVRKDGAMLWVQLLMPPVMLVLFTQPWAFGIRYPPLNFEWVERHADLYPDFGARCEGDTIPSTTFDRAPITWGLVLMSIWALISIQMIPSVWGTYVTQERVTGSKLHQNAAGIPLLLYWLGEIVWDLFAFAITGTVCFAGLWLVTGTVITVHSWHWLLLAFFLFALSAAAGTYFLSFVFKSGTTIQATMIAGGIAVPILTGILHAVGHEENSKEVLTYFFLLVPHSAFAQITYSLTFECVCGPSFTECPKRMMRKNFLLMPYLYMIAESVVYLLFVVLFDGVSNDPYFQSLAALLRCCHRKPKRKTPLPLPPELGEEGVGVRGEETNGLDLENQGNSPPPPHPNTSAAAPQHQQLHGEAPDPEGEPDSPGLTPSVSLQDKSVAANAATGCASGVIRLPALSHADLAVVNAALSDPCGGASPLLRGRLNRSPKELERINDEDEAAESLSHLEGVLRQQAIVRSAVREFRAAGNSEENLTLPKLVAVTVGRGVSVEERSMPFFATDQVAEEGQSDFTRGSPRHRADTRWDATRGGSQEEVVNGMSGMNGEEKGGKGKRERKEREKNRERERSRIERVKGLRDRGGERSRSEGENLVVGPRHVLVVDGVSKWRKRRYGVGYLPQFLRRRRLVADRSYFSVKATETLGLVSVSLAPPAESARKRGKKAVSSAQGTETLMHMLCGLSWPTEGTIWMEGKNLKENPYERWGKLGFCSQDNSVLEPNMTGREVLEMFGRISMIEKTYLRRTVIPEALKLVDLKDLKNRAIKKYSSGDQRKLSFILSLLSGPQILVLDSPTMGIDVIAQQRLWAVLQRAKNDFGKTVVLGSPDPHELEVLSDKIAFIAHGRILTIGTTEAVKSRFLDAYEISLTLNTNVDTNPITDIDQKQNSKLRASIQRLRAGNGQHGQTATVGCEGNDAVVDSGTPGQENESITTQTHRSFLKAFPGTVLLQTFKSTVKFIVPKKPTKTRPSARRQRRHTLLPPSFLPPPSAPAPSRPSPLLPQPDEGAKIPHEREESSPRCVPEQGPQIPPLTDSDARPHSSVETSRASPRSNSVSQLADDSQRSENRAHIGTRKLSLPPLLTPPHPHTEAALDPLQRKPAEPWWEGSQLSPAGSPSKGFAMGAAVEARSPAAAGEYGASSFEATTAPSMASLFCFIETLENVVEFKISDLSLATILLLVEKAGRARAAQEAPSAAAIDAPRRKRETRKRGAKEGENLGSRFDAEKQSPRGREPPFPQFKQETKSRTQV